MRVEMMSRYNNAEEYRSNVTDFCFRNNKVPEKSLFAAKESEYICEHSLPCNTCLLENILKMFDKVDYAILEELGRSKYLTFLQLYQYLMLRNLDVTSYILGRRINKLEKFRLIKSGELKMNEAKDGILYYSLDARSFKVAEERGVIFHKGNGLVKVKVGQENGHILKPADVKRVLVGNMIILGMLMNRIEMERFGIMETVRAQREVNTVGGGIIRTAANVQLDEDSILLYEVVRKTPDSLEKLADKVKRYYALLESDYCEDNYHGHVALPQLVICGENYEHNCVIDTYLREHGLWSEKDSLLYTEDLFYIQATRQMLYELEKDGGQKWYYLRSWDKEAMVA